MKRKIKIFLSGRTLDDLNYFSQQLIITVRKSNGYKKVIIQMWCFLREVPFTDIYIYIYLIYCIFCY